MIDSQTVVRWSALSGSSSLTKEKFLVLISVRGLVDARAIVRLEGLVEKSIDLIGNRTRDLPTCSIVPEPATLQRPPYLNYTAVNLTKIQN
jgi:hypothetical protein